MRDNRRLLTIAHVVDYLMPVMGYQEFLLPKWNAKHGHAVHVFTSDRYTPVPHYDETWGRLLGPRLCGAGVEEIAGVTVHRLKCLWEIKRRPWLSGLEKTIAAIKPDIIFCHGTASQSAFRMAAFTKRLGIPLLMDNHIHFVAQNRSLAGRLYYALLRTLSSIILIQNVYRFLGVAQECCDFLEQEQSLPNNRIECLNLGVDTDIFYPDEKSGKVKRTDLNIPPEAQLVLQTGKLSPDKKPDILIKSIIEIMEQKPDVWLVFVGAGEKKYLDTIFAPIFEKKLSDRLLSIPFVPASQLADIYRMADICVYPGESTLSCLEAAACGKAVVMTDLPVGKWREKHGIGLCYQTGDTDDLRRKLDSLISDPDCRRILGERANRAVSKSFSYDIIARKAEAMMFDALKKRHKL